MRTGKRLRDTDCMGQRGHIESREKLFVVVGDGHIELEEAERMLEALVCSGAMGHRELFDSMLTMALARHSVRLLSPCRRRSFYR